MKLTHKEDLTAVGHSRSRKREETQIKYTHLQLRDPDQVSRMPTDFCIMSSPFSPHLFHAHHLTSSPLFPFHLPSPLMKIQRTTFALLSSRLHRLLLKEIKYFNTDTFLKFKYILYSKISSFIF